MAEGQQKDSIMAGEEREKRGLEAEEVKEVGGGRHRQTGGRGSRERIRFPGLF